MLVQKTADYVSACSQLSVRRILGSNLNFGFLTIDLEDIFVPTSKVKNSRAQQVLLNKILSAGYSFLDHFRILLRNPYPSGGVSSTDR